MASTGDDRRPEDRSYDQALEHLARLPSNQSVVSTFSTSAGHEDSKRRMNASALGEMTGWLARVGITPASLAASSLRCVHVAGTKGKGSVSALVASVLARYPAAAGRVGVYASPHVGSVRERIVLDGRPIGRELFARHFWHVWEALVATGPGKKQPRPFYFGFLTVLALHVFMREGVRSAVVECGIGGEFDSTNVLPAASVTAAAVTQLGIDHVAMLGHTLEQIAWHKAGIFRPGLPAFTRRRQEETVMDVLRARAAEKGAVLTEIRDEHADELAAVLEPVAAESEAGLQGPWQKYNMILAVAVARRHLIALGHGFEAEFATDDYPLAALPGEFRTGLKAARLPGRCQRLTDEDGIDWFLDGAHTEESVGGVGSWFASQTSGHDGIRILLFNQQDRDLPALLARLLDTSGPSAFTHAIFTRNDDEPDGDVTVQDKAGQWMRESSPKTEIEICGALRLSLGLIRTWAEQARTGGKSCKVLVTGSFHLVGPVLRAISHVDY